MKCMKQILRRIELSWHVLSLVLLTSAFVPLWLSTAIPDLQQRDSIIKVTWLFSYASIPIVGLHLRQLKECIKRRWQLLPFLFLSTLSLLWSYDTHLTLRHLYLLILSTLYGFLLSHRYPFSTVLRLLATAMAIIILSSYVSIVAGFEWAVMKEPSLGAWCGVMTHKNFLGSISALAIITFILVANQSPLSQRLGWWFLASIAIILMIRSRSMTALLSFVATTIAWMVIRGLVLLSHQDRIYAIALSSSFFIPCGAALVLHWPEIAALLGRDVGLTGRLPLWISLLRIGWAESMLGHGYGAFWLDPLRMTSIDKAMLPILYPWATQAHNGFLEIWLDLGFLGLICILPPILIVLVRSVKIFLQKKDQNYCFVLLFLTFWITNNLSEALLAKSDLFRAFFWVIFSWMYFSKEIDMT